MEMDVEGYLRRRYESQIADIEIVEKEDLDLVSDFLSLSLSFNFKCIASPLPLDCDLYLFRLYLFCDHIFFSLPPLPAVTTWDFV
jgi:hypothetical protein